MITLLCLGPQTASEAKNANEGQPAAITCPKLIGLCTLWFPVALIALYFFAEWTFWGLKMMTTDSKSPDLFRPSLSESLAESESAF